MRRGVGRIAISRVAVRLSALAAGAATCTLILGPASAASIKGTVQFVGSAPEQKKLAVTIDQFVCGKDKPAEDLVLGPQKGIRNAVVWIESQPPGAKWQTPLPVAQIDQKGCVYTPHVVVMPTGGTIEFLNSDRLLHNIHSVSKENPSLNRTQPKGRTITLTLSRPEIIRVKCDLHSWMQAWIVVAEHPLYAVTNADGEFGLHNLPPGKYRLHVWQESLGTVTREVTVGSEDVAGFTVEMKGK